MSRSRLSASARFCARWGCALGPQGGKRPQSCVGVRVRVNKKKRRVVCGWGGFPAPPEAAQHGSDSRLAAGVILALDLDEFDATCCVAELSALVRLLFEASPCRVVCALTFASGSRHLATLHQESYQHRESDRRRGSRGPCLFGPVCCCSHFAATPRRVLGMQTRAWGRLWPRCSARRRRDLQLMSQSAWLHLV